MTYAKLMDRVRPRKFNCATCHESFRTRGLLDNHKASSHPTVELGDWEKKMDR